MSPANSTDCARNSRGFSLTELLVAMAIFVTLMGGITALFIGAVDTVRQGNQQMEIFEIGRSTLAVMERDLKAGFTARELGQFYQFHGQPNAFTFVGRTSDSGSAQDPNEGQLQRVTYALHPTAQGRVFKTELPVKVNPNTGVLDVRERIALQAIDRARDNGATEDQLNDYVTSALALIPAPIAGDGDIPRLSVEVHTGSIVRVSEPGQSDLDTLRLPDDLQWPQMDASNPGRDIPPAEGGEEALYGMLLQAINPSPTLNPSSDLRLWLVDPARRNQITAINARMVEAVLAARKREIWLRMFMDDLPTTLPAYWWSPQDGTASNKPRPHNFAVASDVVISANLLGPNGQPIFLPDPVVDSKGQRIPLNALYVGAIFSYSQAGGDVKNEGVLEVPHFNDNSNILGYNRAPYPGAPVYLQDGDVTALDQGLRSLLGGAQLATNSAIGSPLAPRLPRMVHVGFFIMRPKTRVGGPDMLRWFSQGIDMPSGMDRDIPNTLVPAAGST
jgi:prepilin-type N-terminal cleavage/methylation domain-containing protein